MRLARDHRQALDQHRRTAGAPFAFLPLSAPGQLARRLPGGVCLDDTLPSKVRRSPDNRVSGLPVMVRTRRQVARRAGAELGRREAPIDAR